MSDFRQRLWALTAASRHAGGSTIERHHHEDHQLVYVSAGVLAVETSAGNWVASKDRAVWLPAGVWHAHRFYGSSMFHAIGFTRERPPLPDIAPMIVAVTPFLRELLIAAADPELTAPETGRVRAVLRDQLRRSAQQPLSLPTPRDPRLADACALASAEPAVSIPLADLARQVGASERSLSRLFRDELGMSYPQWRTHLRLLEAMILLSGGASVTHAASQCGWKTTSSFIDTFRRTLGQTPGDYRARTR